MDTLQNLYDTRDELREQMAHLMPRLTDPFEPELQQVKNAIYELQEKQCRIRSCIIAIWEARLHDLKRSVAVDAKQSAPQIKRLADQCA